MIHKRSTALELSVKLLLLEIFPNSYNSVFTMIKGMPVSKIIIWRGISSDICLYCVMCFCMLVLWCSLKGGVNFNPYFSHCFSFYTGVFKYSTQLDGLCFGPVFSACSRFVPMSSNLYRVDYKNPS